MPVGDGQWVDRVGAAGAAAMTPVGALRAAMWARPDTLSGDLSD
jgi:hypothetical protein